MSPPPSTDIASDKPERARPFSFRATYQNPSNRANAPALDRDSELPTQTLFRLALRLVFIRVRSWLRFARAERVASLPGRNSHRATRSFNSNRSSGGRTRESTKGDDEYFVVAVRKDRRSGRQQADTVNYSAVAEETQNFVRDQSLNLIETLADRLALHLLKAFPIQKVTIEVRKFPLSDAKYVSATVTRIACVG